jgi:type IV secretion system protein VirD4
MYGNRWSFKKRSYFIILLAVALMAFEPDSGLTKAVDLLLQCLMYYQLYVWLFDGIDLARVFVHRKHTMIPGTNKGSARWASDDDHRQNGQFKTSGVFLGASAHSGKPLFAQVRTHGLTVSPAGGGKTVNFVIPALMHLKDMPIIVTDLKGTLACITKETREKIHGHKVVCVNPGGLYKERLGVPARYNPLQILADDWESEHKRDLVTDVQAIALQLLPEPARGGENVYFRNGSRKILAFAFLYLVTHEEGIPTLSAALRFIRRDSDFGEALDVASETDILDGDLADLALDLLPKFNAENEAQWQSFREGAIQALDVFSSSTWLAESTSACDFRFSDLKKEKITVYLIADPTRMKVYAPWLGLLGWCALTELTRCRNNKEVLFLLDETTNFRIEGLSNALTTLREYGCRVWFVIQELEEYAKVYGREALETLLSQCECKVFFGIQSTRTAEIVSRMLGETTIRTRSDNLGKSVMSDPSHSAGEDRRALLTPDEVMRFDDSIIFIGNQPPIHALKVGYQEIKPFAQWAKSNPMFEGDFIGKSRIHLRYPKKAGKRVKITRYKWQKNVIRSKKSTLLVFLPYILLEGLRVSLTIAPFLAAGWFFIEKAVPYIRNSGAPHMLYAYDTILDMENGKTIKTNCVYWNGSSHKKSPEPDCPLIRWKMEDRVQK